MCYSFAASPKLIHIHFECTLFVIDKTDKTKVGIFIAHYVWIHLLKLEMIILKRSWSTIYKFYQPKEKFCYGNGEYGGRVSGCQKGIPIVRITSPRVFKTGRCCFADQLCIYQICVLIWFWFLSINEKIPAVELSHFFA